MGIAEGWCVQGRCDRCGYALYMPYSAKLSAAEALARRGWRVDGERALCPRCAKLREVSEELAGKPARKRRKWWRR